MIKRMINRYRRFSWLTDWRGIKATLVDVYGKGNPEQPSFNHEFQRGDNSIAFDEAWFINTIRDKVLHHPDGVLEYPFLGERIFQEPLIGFVRGDDPLIAQYKEIIGPHHFSPVEIMAWQAEKNGVTAPPAEELSVVCVIMPLAKATRQDNARQESPGFINTHTHEATVTDVTENIKSPSNLYVFDGVTFWLGGNCGMSPTGIRGGCG